MVTRTLVYERATKRYHRFIDPERGTVQYVSNEDFEALGRPERIELSVRPAAALELAQAA